MAISLCFPVQHLPETPRQGQPSVWDVESSDRTQLNISTPSGTGEAVNVLTQRLEAIWDPMGQTRLWLNPNMTKLLWLFGSPVLEMLLSLVLEGAVLPHSRLVHNLGVLLVLQLLLEVQVV